ncbi:MAG: hypothetical protein RLY35_1199 [Bacteroidota bacterium]|jgi:RND family efflux transporter MFP subunit
MNKIFSIIAISAVLISGCHNEQPKEAEKTEAANAQSINLNSEQIQQLKIEWKDIQMDTISSIMSIGGKIITPAQGSIDLGYPISAKVNALFIEPGSPVSKGQKLLSLSDLSLVELQQDYLLQRAELQNLQLQFNRLTVIKNQNATSEKNYQDAELALNKSKIAVAGMEQKMNLLMIPFPNSPKDIQQSITINAPISGKINEIKIKSGQYCQAGQSLLSIVNSGELQCELISFQNVPLKLTPGMKVKLKDNNGTVAQGVVQRFSNSLQENDHGLHIWLSIQNAPADWIPGITINGFLSVQELNSLPVPTAGIAYWESKPQIFECSGNNQFTMKEVTILKEENNIAYIQYPDMGKKPIVTKSGHYLLMALKNTGE